MKLYAFTITLNGFATIKHVVRNVSKARDLAAHVVVEGYAKPVKDTSWCKDIRADTSFVEDGVSSDWTHDWLLRVANGQHPDFPRLHHIYQHAPWEGKVEMCNAAIDKLISLGMQPGDILMQFDGDEVWQPWQIDGAVDLFREFPSHDAAFFNCRYYVTPHKCILRNDNQSFGNRESYEWLRAWRWNGNDFTRHEPPEIPGVSNIIPHAITRERGLIFDHLAMVDQLQVAFKEKYYGMKGALEAWHKLCETPSPCRVRDIYPFVGDDVWAVGAPRNIDDLGDMQKYPHVLHLLYHHGLGDAFICAGMVKHYADANPDCLICIYAAAPYFMTVCRLHAGSDNVKVHIAPDMWHAHDYACKLADRPSDVICTGWMVPNGLNRATRNGQPFDIIQYGHANVPHSAKYEFKIDFFIANYEQIRLPPGDGEYIMDLFTTNYQQIPLPPGDGEYILVHEDRARGYAINPEKFPNVTTINVSPDYHPAAGNMMSWYEIATSPRCIAIHCIDSSFLNFCMLLEPRPKRLLWHVYARGTDDAPHFPDWIERVYN